MKLLKPLNLLYFSHLIIVFLVGFGFIDRIYILFLAAFLAGFFIFWPVEKSMLYFIRAIPFFVALPLNFACPVANSPLGGFCFGDSLNLWRVLSIIIFIKFFGRKIFNIGVKNLKLKLKTYGSDYAIIALCIFFIAAGLSLFKAPDFIAGAKKIIYLINIGLVPAVLYFLIKSKQIKPEQIFKNIIPPAVIVTIIGFVQLLMTYYMPIDEFLYFWALIFDKGFYGRHWAEIAAFKGNTWFAYFGQTLSLRMFSTFADSHSFPMFILLSLASITVYLRKKFSSFIKYSLILIPFYLAVILSGTRGMWVAGISMPLALFFLRKKLVKIEKKYILGSFIIFIALFSVAYPILASPQFHVFKDTDVLGTRIKSILDFDELSNKGRIFIWKQTLKSIVKNPFLGVGIGNFPVVLKEDISFTKAGSTAHNLYLHIAAEMGLPALAIILFLLFEIYKKIIALTRSDSQIIREFSIWTLVYLTWVLFYSMTDAVLLDERTLLLFGINMALISGLSKKAL